MIMHANMNMFLLLLLVALHTAAAVSGSSDMVSISKMQLFTGNRNMQRTQLEAATTSTMDRKRGGAGGYDTGSTCNDVMFDHQVLVTLTGRPYDVTPAELMALEQAFLVSYNSVSSCGATFRTVQQVLILTDYIDAFATRRQLRVLNSTRIFSYRYRCIGYCRGLQE
jgi:hypothetical protein